MASAPGRGDDAGMAAPRVSFGRDLGLQVRMLLTMALLGLLYVVLVVVLLAAGVGTAAMLVIVAALALAQLFLSDKLALRAIGAHEVSPREAPGLHAMIDRLCVQADLPKPRIAIADTPVPNAFAMGRSPRHAVVCATTGILQLLEPHELEGVMAHELAHVKHRDVLIMTVASFFASVAAMVMQFGLLFGGVGGRDREGGQPAFVVVLLVSAVVYAVSFVLMLALSRYREFVADRGAALTTGRPSALASALRKLSDGMQRVPQRDLRAAAELNAFFIVPAGAKGTLRSLLSTHPPTEQRLAALARLEDERAESTRRALEAQESERLRVAQELHDEIGQNLTAALLQLGRVNKRAPAELRPDLSQAAETVRENLDDLRRIAQRLRPQELDELGLASALAQFSDRLSEQAALPIARRFDRHLPALGHEQELVVYRVAQEALTNVVRHAQATRAELSLERAPDRLILRVRDDGRGLGDATTRTGGIRGMRERAALIRAELIIQARGAGGTEVALHVPLSADGLWYR
jgi:heat shock protein HtpX